MIELRTATGDDLELLKRALFEAVSWNPERELPPYELVIPTPSLRATTRAGAAAVISRSLPSGRAKLSARPSAALHGRGSRPWLRGRRYAELAVAVWDGHRGEGIGTQLMDGIEAAARLAGFTKISLSVDADNPARRLYDVMATKS